ncbi:11214_t:CDS:2, partial [Racocetra fulgida]
MASILEVGVDGQRFFNVFDAAPENDRDGPSQQMSIERKDETYQVISTRKKILRSRVILRSVSIVTKRTVLRDKLPQHSHVMIT